MTTQQIQELVQLLQKMEVTENKRQQVFEKLLQIQYHLYEALEWLNSLIELYKKDDTND